MPATKLDKLLKSASGGDLKTIIQTAQIMDSLAAALRATLQADLAEHLLAAALREDGELVAVCSSSSWASRIRFESDALLDAARKAGFQPTSLRVTVSRS